jgi:hypothetical protein
VRCNSSNRPLLSALLSSISFLSIQGGSIFHPCCLVPKCEGSTCSWYKLLTNRSSAENLGLPRCNSSILRVSRPPFQSACSWFLSVPNIWEQLPCLIALGFPATDAPHCTLILGVPLGASAKVFRAQVCKCDCVRLVFRESAIWEDGYIMVPEPLIACRQG